MLFERDDYDQRRLGEFEERMLAVEGHMSELKASRWRFNNPSEIPCNCIPLF